MLHTPARFNESDTVYELRARIAELEAMLGLEWLAPACLRLTPRENDVLGLVVCGKAWTRPRMFTLLYSAALDPPDETIINVYMSKIRTKLRPFGVEVKTQWGKGYRITPENLERLNALYADGERPEES